MPLEVTDPQFFSTPAEWSDWLRRNHDKASEVWVGYYRKASGVASMTWSESVDEALCWGWIDGICKKLDAIRYVHRFTPRRPKSIWSKINLAKVADLEAQGRMEAPGRAAFERRETKRSGLYSFEQDKPTQLSTARARALKSLRGASTFFAQQTPSYRRTAIFWVESAKQEMTRARRFDQLIAACKQEVLLRQVALGRKPQQAAKKK